MNRVDVEGQDLGLRFALANLRLYDRRQLMGNSIATLGIPLLVIFVAMLLLSSSALCYLAAGIIAFVIALACQSSSSRHLPAYLKWIAAVFLLLVAIYLAWGLAVIDGSPTEWPRNYPYPDKLVMAVHENMNPASVMPFGNKKTFLVVGGAILVCCAVAGWLLQGSKFGNLLHGAQKKNQSRREPIFRATLGAVLGLSVGLFPVAMLGKVLPITLLLPPIGAFAGAILATRSVDDTATKS